jgi:phosphoserine phosphatase RsbU/P
MRSPFENRGEGSQSENFIAPHSDGAPATRPIATSYLREPIKLRHTALGAEANTVLVVSADGNRLRQLANALAGQDCELLAADGETALQVIRYRQPSLIVLDISLPGKNGLQICAELRDDELSRHIPIILLSNGMGGEEKLQGLRLGAVDYITEPFDWAEVAAQVCSQVKLERRRRELTAANFDLMTKQAQHHMDLKAAADIQKSLLPRYATENFQDVSLSWRFLPLDQVGGDLLGYSWLDEDHLAAYVIDVCGHGLPAAMMTAAISISLAPSNAPGDERATLKQRAAFSPRQVLETLDREYPIERFERPFTISYLVLNRKTGEYRCSRAGHPMPIIIRKGGHLESIEAGGTIIGLDHMLPFDEEVGRLNPGDSILLYSDGVTECVNESGVFGLEGLSRVLGGSSESSPDTVCERIMAELFRFSGDTPMHDDITLLALTYKACPQVIEEEFRVLPAHDPRGLSRVGN